MKTQIKKINSWDSNPGFPFVDIPSHGDTYFTHRMGVVGINISEENSLYWNNTARVLLHFTVNGVRYTKGLENIPTKRGLSLIINNFVKECTRT